MATTSYKGNHHKQVGDHKGPGTMVLDAEDIAELKSGKKPSAAEEAAEAKAGK